MNGKLEFIKLLTQPKKRRRNENKEKHCKVHVHVGQAIGKFSLATIFFGVKKSVWSVISRAKIAIPRKRNTERKQKMLHREFSGMLLVFFSIILSSYVNKVFWEIISSRRPQNIISHLNVWVWVWVWVCFSFCFSHGVQNTHQKDNAQAKSNRKRIPRG